jgi:hypothetical protein
LILVIVVIAFVVVVLMIVIVFVVVDVAKDDVGKRRVFRCRLRRPGGRSNPGGACGVCLNV